MKRSLLVILALLLTLSICLVGCNLGKSDPVKQPNDAPAENNDNNKDENKDETPKYSQKEVLIQNFNADNLGEVVAVIEEGLAADAVDMIGGEAMSDELKSFIASMAIGADLSVANGNYSASLTAAVKDNYVYVKNSENNETAAENFIHFADDKIVMSVKNGNEWASQSVPYNALISGGDTSQVDAYMEIFDNVLAAIKGAEISALTEERLTEKDGLVVVDMNYFTDIIEKNVDAIATAVGEELSAEDKADGMKEIKEVISSLGLELAFGTDEDSITKLSVSLNVDPDTEYGKQLVDENIFDSMSLVIELTADGKNIKQVDFNSSTDYSDLIDGFKFENHITIASIFDGDEVVGADIDAKVGAIEFDYDDKVMTEDEENPDESYTQVFATVTVDGVIDFSKINTAGADVIKLTATSKTDKAVKMVSTYDAETGDYSEPKVEKVLTDSELADHKFDLAIDLSLKATSSVKLALAINVNLPGETDKVTVSGNVYFTEVTNFPTIPDSVKNPVENN